MVSSSVNAASTIETRSKTVSSSCCENAIDSRGIQTFEEGEDLGIIDCSVLERLDLVDSDVRVGNEHAIIQLLRSSEVVGLRVDEVTSLHIDDSQLEIEALVRRDDLKVERAGELGSGHAGFGDDVAHDSRVAATSGNLLAVGQRKLWAGQAKVDEVVRRSQ